MTAQVNPETTDGRDLAKRKILLVIGDAAEVTDILYPSRWLALDARILESVGVEVTFI